MEFGFILMYPAVWPQQTWSENWGRCPFLVGVWELDAHTQCGWGWGLPPCQVSSWSI